MILFMALLKRDVTSKLEFLRALFETDQGHILLELGISEAEVGDALIRGNRSGDKPQGY